MSYNPISIGRERTRPTFPIQVDAPQSTAFPNAVLQPLLSNGSDFFQAGDRNFYPAGLSMTSNMDTAGPFQPIWSSPPEPTVPQEHCRTASSASTLSLPIPSADPLPSSPSTTVTLVDQLPESQTEDELRARLNQYIESEQWFEDDEPEPTVGAQGVPEWATRLAPHGRSIYECFVKTAREKGSIVYKCCSHGCKFKSTRLRRVVGHQRKKRNHKPFVCKAHPEWYVLAAAVRATILIEGLVRSQ